MTIDISIDIETFGTRHDAAIVAIGAVAFDRHAQGVRPPKDWLEHTGGGSPLPSSDDLTFFYRVLTGDIGTIDPDTIRWWLQQSDEARREISRPVRSHGVRNGLTSLAYWMAELLSDAHVDPGRPYGISQAQIDLNQDGNFALWAHEGFDLTILESAYLATGWAKPPWHHRANHGLRALYEAAGGRPDMRHLEVVHFPRSPTPHHALWDAWRQAHEVQACFARLRSSTITPADVGIRP